MRPAVIYRKLSFGTQSQAGSRFIERMLTVCETCRLQKRSVFQWLTTAVEAKLPARPTRTDFIHRGVNGYPTTRYLTSFVTPRIE